jgi:hypothetical protein
MFLKIDAFVLRASRTDIFFGKYRKQTLARVLMQCSRRVKPAITETMDAAVLPASCRDINASVRADI